MKLRSLCIAVLVLLAVAACADALSDSALRKRLHSRRLKSGAEHEGVIDDLFAWAKRVVGQWRGTGKVQTRTIYPDKSNPKLVADPKGKAAATGDAKPKATPSKTAPREKKRDASTLKSAGIVFVQPDVFTTIKNTRIGSAFSTAAKSVLDAVQDALANIQAAAGSTSQSSSRRNKNVALLEEQETVDQSQIRCYWVYSESSGDVPATAQVVDPAPTCWSDSFVFGSYRNCADVDTTQGPGPHQSAMAQRYGEGLNCFSDEQRTTPGTKEGQRVDNIAFVCRDAQNNRVQTPSTCQPRIFMQAAFYGQALTSTHTGGVCPLGERKMNAFSGIEAAWSVGDRTLFNKGAVTQSGNEITEHYSVALGPKATLSGKGPGAEIGVTVGMTTDVKNDFKDTNAAAYVVASGEFTDNAASVLKSSATVSMTASGRVGGSAEVKTLGWGIWYVMEARGQTGPADCKGARTAFNYRIIGNEKYDEIVQTARRFFAGKEITNHGL